ncbi:ComEC/Rec2 family competence protein [Paraburkholderia sp. SARCC-3016]|uniref:ComEC/Rec2 family competence protein n=1 Tax=Paraburkholderia sp. SARCC-3016 TaxID=3058611 RepID=UPI00280920F7|nr:ComEC/Rec2 family competence protein [Paraburkholderia sp. SARCC-3016]MDQ7980409.1 ComEC/Rec2 family competence protein [Paraburkholderia sp. SARCC-3016]
MRAVWCGFALGVVWLQRQAALPEKFGAAVLAVTACGALGVAIWGLRRRGSACMTCRRAAWCAIWLAAFCAGFGYAAWRAHARLAYALPVEWEGRDIEVRGYIEGLPTSLAGSAGSRARNAGGKNGRNVEDDREAAGARDKDGGKAGDEAANSAGEGAADGAGSRAGNIGDTGSRFVFNVESTDTPVPDFPRRLQLSWIAQDAPLPEGLAPGARWRLFVRLKRAHGNANFGVRDAEATLFARNIRATGYVTRPAAAQRLPGDAHGIGMTVDRWRAALRARIDGVLADAPHRGIVVALAIGAQDAVSAVDWQLMRATGTSHLVAISGLHIGFVAGLAAWLAGAIWRRSGFVGARIGIDWPLVLPAQKVAVPCGALFAAFHAALAGFNVPAQRALWMLAVVALAFVSGRTVAPSVVLAWALGLVLLIDPWAVLAAGFWLSFCAVAAILFAMSGRAAVRADDNRRPRYGSLDDEDWLNAGAPHEDRRLGDTHDRLTRRAFRTRLVSLATALRLRARTLTHAFVERTRSGAHVQFAVTVALAPLTAYWFAQIPLIGPLANAFAIPWVSVLVTPLVLAGVALPAPLDAFAFSVAHRLLDVLTAGLHLVSGPAWALWRLPQPDAWALAAAAAGVIWCLAPRGWPMRWAAPIAWLPLLMPPSSAPPHGTFRLTALDIGQGSAIVVETAHHALLFDAGPGPESTHAGERVVVPYLQAAGLQTLDTLVISHADSDHSGGAAAVLDGVSVRQLLAALPPDHVLWQSARAAGAGTVPCAAGQRWQWDGVEFAMLWPDAGPLRGKTNAHCCVLRVSASASTGRNAAGRTIDAAARADANLARDIDAHADARPRATALLTADIEAAVERTLLARDRDALRAQVLLAPHHGSKTSSTEPFLDAIDPLIAIFQVGYRNRFHHPHPGVFARYLARHIELPRSDEDGAVRIEASADALGKHQLVLTLERYRETHRRYWMD